jgi:hypothetical protein
MKTNDQKRKKGRGGFVATFFVMAAMIMMTFSSLGAFAAAESYDDSVTRREYRLQAGLNAQSCVSVALLAFAHDYFYSASGQSVPAFSCMIVSAARNGSAIAVQTVGYDRGISESASATAQDTGRSIE